MIKFIKNIFLILSLTILLVVSATTLSAIVNLIANNANISLVYVVIFSILITLRIKGKEEVKCQENIQKKY